MKHKVIKPVAHGHFEEVWEDEGRGAGQRRAKSKAPNLAVMATARPRLHPRSKRP